MDKKFWLKEPAEHKFPDAQDYLELLFKERDAADIVRRLRKVKTTEKKAKDILRASKLPLLPKDNIHVRQDLSKVKKGKKLSPVLLVRREGELIIADGYHRVCSIYYLSEDLVIPCRIVGYEE